MTSPPPPSPAPRAADGPLYRYGLAVAAPLVALGVTWVATPLQERSTFLLFFGAVALASWHGLGPGLVATALSALAVDVAFIPPIGGVKPIHAEDGARLVAFAGVAAFIAALSERSRVARAEADEQRVEAEALARQLQDQAVDLEQQTAEAQALAAELEQSNQALEEAGRRVDAERARLALHEARYRALVEAAATTVWTTDAEGRVADVPVWRERTGQTVEQVRGTGWLDALHPADRPGVEHRWRESIRSRRPYEAEYRVRLAEGGYRWYQAHAVPMLDAAGGVREWVGTFADVHEQRRAESALALLAGASRLLESSLDVGNTLHAVARLAVPGLADYCVLHVVGDDGAATHVVAHTNPAGEAALRLLAQRAPADPGGELGWTAAMRTGQPQHHPNVDGADGAYARDPEHRRLLEAVGTRSAIVAPLAARVRVLGAMTLGSTDPDRRFDERDVAVAEQLANRVALALESARLFDAERRARAAAEAANQAKSEFLATMSHELRTPLNAVLGYAALMADEITGPVNAAQRAQLGRVTASARHLLALIEEILTLSRLDAGRETVRAERVDLGELARETAEMVEPSLSVRGLRFTADIPAAPAYAHTDAVKVRQVLLNLLANAAKFTERGEVSLALRPSGDRVAFEVRDTGIGIAPEHHARIFDPFWQVEQSATRRAGGTGLGLHVARRLARLLGGDVTVASEWGRGSTFTFTVAVADPADDRLSAVGARLSAAPRPRAESREPSAM